MFLLSLRHQPHLCFTRPANDMTTDFSEIKPLIFPQIHPKASLSILIFLLSQPREDVSKTDPQTCAFDPPQGHIPRSLPPLSLPSPVSLSSTRLLTSMTFFTYKKCLALILPFLKLPPFVFSELFKKTKAYTQSVPSFPPFPPLT